MCPAFTSRSCSHLNIWHERVERSAKLSIILSAYSVDTILPKQRGSWPDNTQWRGLAEGGSHFLQHVSHELGSTRTATLHNCLLDGGSKGQTWLNSISIDAAVSWVVSRSYLWRRLFEHIWEITLGPVPYSKHNHARNMPVAR